jgi:hypothetical protein
MIDISKYSSYFHDGSIFNIEHIENTIILSMSSAQMDVEDLNDDITLSANNCIQGKLHLEKVKKIIVDKKPIKGTFKLLYDDAEILDFEIKETSVIFFIQWINYPPKSDIAKYSDIQIKSDKIWWENIPDLETYS